MVDHSDLPGPGEQVNPNAESGETHSNPIPDGDLPRVCAVHTPRTQTQELSPVALHASEDVRDGTDRTRQHRTSTDSDVYEVMTPSTYPTEQQRDRSAGDQRETVFDPAQDNAGPHSDKG